MMALNIDVARLPSWRTVVQTCLVLLGLAIAKFLIKLYQVRSKFQRMQKDGLPMPPHHPLFGHLKLVAGIMSQFPSDVHNQILPNQLRRRFPEMGTMFYLDTWPFGDQLFVVVAPDAANQFTQSHSLPKFHALAGFLHPLTGGNDLVSMEGSQWKTWRNIFNPGFKGSHLLTLIPEIMKDVSLFCDILRKAAEKSDIVLMDPIATRLTLDVIGRVALDTQLDSQLRTNDFVSALRKQIKWLSFGDTPIRFHPLRPMAMWWNDRIMVKYIWQELNNRFKSRQIKTASSIGGKTIIDLALNEYLSSMSENGPVDSMDTTFRDFATSQLRVFIFAGHDTTSSTICYAFHLLSSNPKARQSLINEHNRILGPDHNQAATQVNQDPYLLNRLPYTLAVVKETLRLYPPAATARGGEPGYFVSGPDGRQYPTHGFLIWSASYSMQRDTEWWADADKFIPERWLVEEGDRLYPVKGAYRPFEFGPRNCIGQELAMLELKLVLVMTTRTFEFRTVYDEWDQLHPRSGPRTVDGDRAYQVLSGAAHPVDGLPCRVSLAK